MILAPQDLQERTLDELRSIVTDYHASWHHREKRETLIDRICELSAIVQPDEKDVRKNEQQKPVEKKEDARMLTSEDVLKGLSAQIESGLLIKINNGTWSIRFRDKQDTGSMSMPIRTIQRCADAIMHSKTKMPKCQLCGEQTEFREGIGYICVNPACKRQVKPANPGKAA